MVVVNTAGTVVLKLRETITVLTEAIKSVVKVGIVKVRVMGTFTVMVSVEVVAMTFETVLTTFKLVVMVRTLVEKAV